MVIIKGTGNYYITKDGRVFNSKKGTYLKNQIDRDGYEVITIRRKCYKIHRLICEAYLDNPDNKPTVHHIDGNKLNNTLENLAWATYTEQNALKQHANQWVICQNIQKTAKNTYRVHVKYKDHDYYAGTHKTLNIALIERDKLRKKLGLPKLDNSTY